MINQHLLYGKTADWKQQTRDQEIWTYGKWTYSVHKRFAPKSDNFVFLWCD